MDGCEMMELELYEMMATGKSIAAIVKRAGELLGNPVIVPDSTGGIIAVSTQDYIHDTVWNNLLDKTSAAEQLMRFGVDERAGVAQLPPGEVMMLDFSDFEHRWLYANVAARYFKVGAVSLLEYDRELDEGSADVVKCLANIVSHLYEHNRLWKRESNYEKRQVLLKLLNDFGVEPELVAGVYPEIDFSQQVDFVLLAMQPVEFISHVENLLVHQRWIEQQYPEAVGVLHADMMVFLFVAERASEGRSVVLPPPRKLAEYARKHNLLMGLSRNFKSVDQFGDHYRQAVWAMRLCRLDMQGNCQAFDDRWDFGLFEGICRNIQGEGVIWGKVVDVMRYDEAHGTECLADLTAYLVSGCSYTKAADVLQVHRNTVKYRIERLTEMFGFDFENDDEVFFATVSVRFLEYRRRRLLFERYADAIR